MNRQPVVSVMIPCYNGEKYIDKCLTSLLNQTYDNIEVIIVNDGSTDTSENIIDSYINKFKNSGKKLIKLNQQNQGQAAAINCAMKHVSGEYIMWQDVDDWYEIDAVESLLEYLLTHNLNIVRGEVAFRTENNIDKVLRIGKSNQPRDKIIFDDYIFETDSYCFCGIFMVEGLWFDKCIKDRNIYNSRAGQNWQLILPISYNNQCGYLNKVVYNCRIVGNSHSHAVKKTVDLLKRCDEHKDILMNVIDSMIDMEDKKKKEYKRLIKLKYYRKKLILILKSGVKIFLRK